MENIWEAGLYGAIGGALGAILGVFISRLFPGASNNAAIKVIPVVVCATLFVQFADDIFKPIAGGFFPESRTETSELDQTIAALEEYPLTKAIFERDPDTKSEMRAKLSTLMRTEKNLDAVKTQAFSISFELISTQLINYLKRGQDADLLQFSDVTIETMSQLSEKDPETCYNYLYYPVAFTKASRPEDIIGKDRFDAEQNAGAQLVRNANDEPPGYDLAAAEGVLEQAVAAAFAILPQEKASLLTQGTPTPERADAKLACDATHALFQTIRNSAAPVDGLRHAYSLN